MSLVETALIALEVRFLLVVKGAKDYFFLSTIGALVKAKLWPAQAMMYKQQVVERVLSFAQALFQRHSTCEHLGSPGMGSFKDNQVVAFLATPGMPPGMTSDFNGVLPPPNFGVTVSQLFRQIGVLGTDFKFLLTSRLETLIPFWMCSIGMT